MTQLTKVQELVALLTGAALNACLITRDDCYYAVNRLCSRLQAEPFEWPSDPADFYQAHLAPGIPELLQELADEAVRFGLIDDLTDLRDVLMADLMDVFLDKPSVLQARFMHHYADSPRTATDWFYQISQASNYIQTRQIARNIVYQAPTGYGDLDITINLSKPEKNPRDIAAARHQRSTGYPRCLLCVENEGYAGRIGHPARANHRMIRLDLGGEPWFFQYSPYVYYPEHCIVLSREHRDMKINRSTFDRLMQFVTLFPHYFLGSNADLPIVGGSILTHDHYQGGCYELPMARARSAFSFKLHRWPGLACSVLHWPMTAMRLQGEDPQELAEASDMILAAWRSYRDPEADILDLSEQGPHNTVTPIARRRGSAYEMDLVLRNNRQSDEHPLGIFHPHADVHHIKKENIGLIEVMGLAVLPARLLHELEAVEQILQGMSATVAPMHLAWAEQLRRQQHGPITAAEAQRMVRQATAAKFERVLSDAGVFKQNDQGRAAWLRFLAALGATIQ